uniref:hypothetical protein n=1 Tax=Parerythrobacter lutipelagi TaxID=1964208 RepID=UPI0010F4844E|nr:hypothetical protein [Parerythrobacter lutipelagi]
MKHAGKTPWHLWLAGSLAVFWNAFGAVDYTMTQLGNQAWFAFMGFDDATTDAMLEFLGAAPAWADAVWALGVWCGLLGSLLLLARSKWSVWAFLASITGVIGSMIYQANVDYPSSLADVASSPIMYIVLAVALGLLGYAWAMSKRSVLR